MNVFNKINELLVQKGITASTLAKDLGFSSGQLSIWKQGSSKPSADALSKIADYFDVSVDYLLGRTEKSTPTIGSGDMKEFKTELKRLGIDNDADAQLKLLKKISSLSEEQKQLIMQMIDNFKE